MTLKEIVKAQRIYYFKERNEPLKMAYESVLNRIMLEEKSGRYQGNNLPDSIVEGLIAKEIKEAKDVMTFYKEGDPKYEEMKIRIAELEQYLPEEMSEDEVRKIITEIKASGETNKGKIIKAVIEKVGNRFDKSKIAGLI